METWWEIVCFRNRRRQPPSVIFSFLILGSSDLDPSMTLGPGEIIDTGCDYEDQVMKL